MKAPQGPTGKEFQPERNFAAADLPPEHAKDWALQTMNPRLMRLLHREVETMFMPASLRARFTEKEATTIFEDLLGQGLYEIGDLTGSALADIRDKSVALLHAQPFEMTMLFGSIADPDDEVVDATSANLLKTHDQAFSPDPVTESIKAHVQSGPDFQNDASCNALCLDIRGEYSDDEINRANNGIQRLAGYGYNSKIVRPTLSMALQDAISRISLGRPFRPSVTRSTAIGPKGKPILVITHLPKIPIMLCEDPGLIGVPGNIAGEMVISHCLFTPLIAPEDIN